jgi:hypothetical protein
MQGANVYIFGGIKMFKIILKTPHGQTDYLGGGLNLFETAVGAEQAISDLLAVWPTLSRCDFKIINTTEDSVDLLS